MILRGASGYLVNECTDEEILLCGPAGTSKTVAGAAWLLNGCIKYPGSRHLLCRAQRSDLTETTLVTFESVVGNEHPEVKRVNREQRHSYYLYGSTIVVGGLDKDTKLFGSGWGRIVVEEAIEIGLETWDFWGRAARDPEYRRALQEGKVCPFQRCAITNPGDPGHCFNKRATREPADMRCETYEDWLRLYEYSTGPQTGPMRRLLSLHVDNPRFFDTETWTWTEAGKKYISILKKMSGHRRSRMFEGRWVSGVGDPVFDPDGVAWMKKEMERVEKERPTVIPAGRFRLLPVKEHASAPR